MNTPVSRPTIPPPPPPPPPAAARDDVPEMLDVIQKETKNIDGQKITINEVLNVPTVFVKWSFEKTRVNDQPSPDFLRLYFLKGGVLCYLNTSSSVLMDQVREFEKACGGVRPFKATIRQKGPPNGQYFKFFRTTE